MSDAAPSTKRARPPLQRDLDNKVIAGVAAGLGRWMGVDRIIVRIVLLVLVPASGIGIPAYLAGLLLMPTSDGAPPIAQRLRARPGAWQITFGVGCITLGALLAVRELGFWWSDAVTWPLVLAASGLALLWRQTLGRRGAVEPEPRSPRAEDTLPSAAAPGEPSDAETAADEQARMVLGSGIPERLRSIYQGGFGIALVVGAVLLFLQANGALRGTRDLVLSVVVVGIGLGLVLAPFWLRLVRNINDERAARIRSQERAEVAAHLHDSVLQTLALVQKRADDPRAVATLARRQERELRTWLSGAPEARPDECLADALRAAAAEVEEAHGVPVEVVIVGDHELDDRHRALVAAAREALANAVRHSGSEEPIALFMEVAGGRTEVFVRDRGSGFDVGAVGDDRRGVKESIVGRMARHGGHGAVHSTPGTGTEVELVLDD
ncbi:ATP-binding protein [Conexibacter woesei]|uniref:ATP-binding protein n=1 Tax=Conexibacter woesei TaxID=191495 RepID=UPI0004023F6D|nr:ATP-binding protein [Conexibacter woesei]